MLNSLVSTLKSLIKGSLLEQYHTVTVTMEWRKDDDTIRFANPTLLYPIVQDLAYKAKLKLLQNAESKEEREEILDFFAKADL